MVLLASVVVEEAVAIVPEVPRLVVVEGRSRMMGDAHQVLATIRRGYTAYPQHIARDKSLVVLMTVAPSHDTN